jgi:hypothetical protein
MTILLRDGREKVIENATLSSDFCYELFLRNGNIQQINLTLNTAQLFTQGLTE